MKKIAAFLLTCVICLSFAAPALAVGIQEAQPREASEIVPFRAEETKWYFREYNGERQMRLWSVTYAHWKTDWITV